MRPESLIRVPETGLDPYSQDPYVSVAGESELNDGSLFLGSRLQTGPVPLPATQRRDENPEPVNWTKDTLRQGDQVQYYSTSHKNHMKATVDKVYADSETGAVTKADLDIKKKACATRIYPLQGVDYSARRGEVHNRSDELIRSSASADTHYRSPQSDSNPVRLGSDSNPGSPQSPTVKNRDPLKKFQVGDKVNYFSSSYNQQMAAVVEEVRKDGSYNLDVKKGAKPQFMSAWQPESANAIPQREPLREQQDHAREMASPKQVATMRSPTIAEEGPSVTELPSPSPAVVTATESAMKFTREPESTNGLTPTAPAPVPRVVAGPRLPATATQPSSAALATPSPGGSCTPVRSLFMGVGTEGRRPHRQSAPPQVLVSNGTMSGGAVGSRQGALDAGELQMSGPSFDPTQGGLRSALLSSLGFLEASIEQMTGFSGGLNEGVWFVTGSRNGRHEELVLKLVKCTRIASNVPTEAENCEKVHRDHPSIAADVSVSFPVKIFSCMSHGIKRHDLIVMRRVPGERLAEVICRKYYAKQEGRLLQIFEALGRQLADFHARYGTAQHGDFQPSNVFYDEATDALAFIDIGGMGIPCMDNDVAHFRKAMNLLANAYGPTLHSDAIMAFDRGYQRAGGH